MGVLRPAPPCACWLQAARPGTPASERFAQIASTRKASQQLGSSGKGLVNSNLVALSQPSWAAQVSLTAYL